MSLRYKRRVEVTEVPHLARGPSGEMEDMVAVQQRLIYEAPSPLGLVQIIEMQRGQWYMKNRDGEGVPTRWKRWGWRVEIDGKFIRSNRGGEAESLKQAKLMVEKALALGHVKDWMMVNAGYDRRQAGYFIRPIEHWDGDRVRSFGWKVMRGYVEVGRYDSLEEARADYPQAQLKKAGGQKKREVDHGLDRPRGGGFAIMRELQKDLLREQGRPVTKPYQYGEGYDYDRRED